MNILRDRKNYFVKKMKMTTFQNHRFNYYNIMSRSVLRQVEIQIDSKEVYKIINLNKCMISLTDKIAQSLYV